MFSILGCLKQGYRFRTIPAGTAEIYRTGQQSDTLDPPVSYRTVPAGTEKSFFFFFLSFVIFEFLLGQNGNLFTLTY